MKERIIKFRAWDKEHKVMLIPPAIDNPEKEDNEWALMQFTGLLDKNGKEIFEGDVLKSTAPEQYSQDSGVFLVKWKQPNCSFGLTKQEKKEYVIWECEMDWWIEHEIIGNIYENPTLLEGGKN